MTAKAPGWGRVPGSYQSGVSLGPGAWAGWGHAWLSAASAGGCGSAALLNVNVQRPIGVSGLVCSENYTILES